MLSFSSKPVHSGLYFGLYDSVKPVVLTGTLKNNFVRFDSREPFFRLTSIRFSLARLIRSWLGRHHRRRYRFLPIGHH